MNSRLEVEQKEDDMFVEEESAGKPFSDDSVPISEQFNQFLQMAANGPANGGNASAMNVYLNLLLQQMLSNAVGNSSSNSIQEGDDYCSSNSSHQDQFSSKMKQTLVDAEIQTSSDESGVRAAVNDAAVRDTLALELGTILAKKFWPQYYLREDKLKLMVDVIGKLLDYC